MARRNEKKEFATEQQDLLSILEERFKANMHRHKGIKWDEIENRLSKNPKVLSSLNQMEATGGEPDVVVFDTNAKSLFFCDCAAESPKGRRSLCFDEVALAARKENKPKSSAEAMADELGIKLLSESQYQHLQSLGDFDTKTSSWVETPEAIRKLGGALFGDKRYGAVFIYHNGAESYYAARGFRGILELK